MSGGELTCTYRDGVAVLTLARPARRNAISEALYIALRDGVRDAERDERARVVVIRSGVPGVFCAGADIATMADPRPAELTRQFDLLLACIDAFRTCRKLIVTAVQGDCLGVGCALVAASDIAIAQADARFALPEIKLALAPVLAMAALAPVMTPRQLVYWSASGRHFSAREACEAGLVTSVVAPNEVDAFVAELTDELGRADAAALTQIKATARALGQPMSAATRDLLMQDMIAAATRPAARAAIDGFLQRKRRS